MNKVRHINTNRHVWLYVSGALVFVLVLAVIKYGLSKVEQQVRQNTVDSLRTILHISHDSLSQIWLDNLYYDAGEVLSEPDVIQKIKFLLTIRRDVKKLKNHPVQQALKKHFLKNMAHLNGVGFEIISPDYLNLLSIEDDRAGNKNIIYSYYPVKLAKVFAGMPQFVPPIHDRHDYEESHEISEKYAANMFYMVPVKDSEGRTIAVLAVQLNPHQTINSITLGGRVGKTGETILFDRDARLVTESRFQQQLVRDGYLHEGQSSIHNIVLRDPVAEQRTGEENTSTQARRNELTYMARHALAYESGESTRSYRDYRGVPVLGVWLWDEELSIGMATEIDEHEALQPYRDTMAIVLTMFGIALLCTLGFLYFIRMLRKQNLVAIEKSEVYLRVVLENAADGIITISEQGVIQTFNLAAEKLFQYSAREVINHNVDIIVPPSYKAQHASGLENYKKTGSSKLIGRKTNVDGLRQDGTTFPVSIALSEIRLGEKRIFAAIVRDLTVELETQEKLQRYQEELESLVEERSAALMESEAQNRQILESAGEGIYGLNMNGETTFVNPAAAGMLGYQVEELIGKPMHATVHHSHTDGCHYPREQCPMYAAFTDGEVHHVSDEVLWRKDGSSFPVEYTSKPIYSNGERAGAVVTFSDISERLVADAMLKDLNLELENRVNERTAELHRSQSALNRAQQIAHLGSWNWDIVTGELHWSDEIYRIFGLEPQEFTATYDAFVETIHPEDRDAVASAVNASVADANTPYNIEHRIVSPTGDIGHVHEQGEIERDAEGKPLYMVGIVHDITELKLSRDASRQAMQELSRSEQVLRLALLGAGAGYWHFDIKNSALFWDERSLEIFGISAADFNGQLEDWANRVHEDDIESASASFAGALQDKNLSAILLDYRIKKPDGTIRYIHVTGHIERDEAKVATSVYGLHFDVTESKQAEQELVTAMESAEMANRAKSEFLAVMSHEIRTPMNAIIGMSNLVMNTELAPRQHNYLKKVVSSAESLLHIINDILDFSKIEAGQLHMESIDFRLDEVLEKLTHLVVLKAQEKGLEFLFSISKRIPEHLLGDPTRLLQIVVNLASNAVKFTETGEIVLSVELVSEQDDQLELKFTVRDTGIGIEAEKQQRLFRSFSQADASITRKYGGTGLGLVIVKRLVDLMGGEIGFESEVGKGSSFYFTIPFGRSDQVSKSDSALPEEMENLRVLVVDDSESARSILSETLDGFGFTVNVAATCSEAISAVETAEQRGQPYRLVLMDWKMPGQSGVEGAKVILGQSKSPVPPVVMMVTAYSAEDLAEELENIAVTATLVKPISPSSLLDAILNAFKAEQKQAQLHRQPLKKIDPVELLSGKHVLVVEDNELNMELAVELLQEVGIQTSSATNGEEAIKLIEAEPHFDGVLMDVHMPIMGGIEATQLIRSKPQFSSLPIIALTAGALESDKEDILASGMNDVIVKPIQVELMLETLAKWISPLTADTFQRIQGAKPKETDMNLSIPGIDTQAGLETCNGKISLYKRLLKKFIDEVEFTELFKEAMAKGDRDLAERLAHTLKGSAGNIGALGIQQAAKDLQDVFKGNATDKKINPLYKKLEHELMPVIHALGKVDLEPEKDVATKTKKFEPATLIPALDELSVLLADDDTDATEKVEQISVELINSAFESDMNVIARHVSRYEFRDAFDRLNKLTEKIRAA